MLQNKKINCCYFYLQCSLKSRKSLKTNFSYFQNLDQKTALKHTSRIERRISSSRSERKKKVKQEKKSFLKLQAHSIKHAISGLKNLFLLFTTFQILWIRKIEKQVWSQSSIGLYYSMYTKRGMTFPSLFIFLHTITNFIIYPLCFLTADIVMSHP